MRAEIVGTACCLGVGVIMHVVHVRNARRHDGLSARTGPAGVVARLEGYRERCPLQALRVDACSLIKRDTFSMAAAWWLGSTSGDNPIGIKDSTAHRWVRAGGPAHLLAGITRRDKGGLHRLGDVADHLAVRGDGGQIAQGFHCLSRILCSKHSGTSHEGVHPGLGSQFDGGGGDAAVDANNRR